MTAEQIAAAVVVVIAICGGAWRASQLWRDCASALDWMPSGFLRAFPSLIGTAFALFGGAAMVWVLDRYRETDGLSQALAWLVTLLVLLGVVFTVSTAVTAKPRRLVPPHLRRPRRPGDGGIEERR